MFTGVITALVTPFRSGAIDEEALRRLVDDQIANGIDGLVPVGTTGESATLDYEEHIRVIRIVVQEAKKRVPVIAGTGSNSTREAIELSRAALEAGADGLLHVTPYYNKPTQDGLFRHFKAIVEDVKLPTIVYNVPGRTGCDLLPDTVIRLAALPGVVGVKEATGSLQRASQILSRLDDATSGRFAVLSGDDPTAFPLYAVGARGVISVVSNVAPALMSAMWDAVVANDWGRARKIHYQLFALSEGLFIETSPAPTKAALSMMGRMNEELRPPLYPVTEATRAKLSTILADLGLRS